MRGQYQPMLMLLSPAPAHVPSMDLSVVEEFPRFKRLPPGTPLMSTDGSTQLKDAFGTPMTCDGGWIAPKNAEHFQAAIADIHEANERGGQYTGHCDNCRALPLEERYKGCQHHLGEPRLFAKGSPVEHQELKSTMELMKQRAIIRERKIAECANNARICNNFRGIFNIFFVDVPKIEIFRIRLCCYHQFTRPH